MKPIRFSGVNFEFRTNQQENVPLPLLRTKDGMCISCWELSDEELEEIVRNRQIYISQLTFNRGFNPILPATNLADGLIIT